MVEEVEPLPRTPPHRTTPSPPGASPPRHFTPPPPWSPDVPAVELTPVAIPPRYSPKEKTVRRFTREEIPEALTFEEEPVFEDIFDGAPPSPPSPFAYQSPTATPESPIELFVSESPPIRDFLEAHEYTTDFFEPSRPAMRRSIMIGSRRVPMHKPASRPTPLSPVYEHFEEFASPPEYRAADIGFERTIAAAREMTYGYSPEPEPKRSHVCAGPSGPQADRQPVCGKAEASKTGPTKTPKRDSKTSLKRPKSAKRGAKTPKQPTKTGRADTPARTPSAPPAPVPSPPRPEAKTPYRSPAQREQRFAGSIFDDPKHQELLARVTQIIADVGSPILVESLPPEREIFDDIEGLEDIGGTPPSQYAPEAEDLPELSPGPSGSPEFDFQSDISDFRTPPRRPRFPSPSATSRTSSPRTPRKT